MEAGLCCPFLEAELTIQDQPSGVPFGEPLSIALSVINVSERQVERTYYSGQRYDFIVLDDTGNVVWRWSRDMAFTQAIIEVAFEPGQKVTYSEVWNQKTDSGEQVEPGTYELQALDVGCGTPTGRLCALGATLAFEIWAPPQ